MNTFQLEMNKKENGKYVPVGKVSIYYPLLSELGITAEPLPVAVDSNGEVINQGLPVYQDEKLQFVFDSVFNAVKADARNKLVTGTTDLRDGAKIAETLEELLAVAERDGAALKAIRAMLNDFKVYLATQSNKSEKVQAAILSLASNRKALGLQPEHIKSKFEGYLTSFVATLTPEKAAEYSRPILALGEACELGNDLDDM